MELVCPSATVANPKKNNNATGIQRVFIFDLLSFISKTIWVGKRWEKSRLIGYSFL
jgi:hypothetical protein